MVPHSNLNGSVMVTTVEIVTAPVISIGIGTRPFFGLEGNETRGATRPETNSMVSDGAR